MGFAVVGVLFLLGLALAAKPAPARKKPMSVPPAPMPPAQPISSRPPDWSGCGTPPAYCQPPPKFACQQSVTCDLGEPFKANTPYRVVGRTWGPKPDDPTKPAEEWTYTGQQGGIWVYDLADAATGQSVPSIAEENTLTPTTTPATAPTLAPVAAPPAAPVSATPAPMPAPKLPLYPAGLKFRKDPLEAVVNKVWPDGQGNFHYDITASKYGFSKTFQAPEAMVRKQIVEQSGDQDLGQAFPLGATIYARQIGGKILGRFKRGDTWYYSIERWPNEVTEGQVRAEFYKALR